MNSNKYPTVLIRMTGWACTWAAPVLLIGETPKRYRIQAINRLRLPGPNRFLEPGESALVPRYCISDFNVPGSSMIPPPPPADMSPQYEVFDHGIVHPNLRGESDPL